MKRVGDLERKYVLDVLDSQFRTSQGAVYMTRFESAFSDKFKSKFAISHVNGTATMHSTLEASGIGPGDEVIVPPLTMSATSLAVLHANATPIFADIDIDTFVIDAKSIEEKIFKNEDIFGRGTTLKKIELDSSYPEYIFKNKHKFLEWTI